MKWTVKSELVRGKNSSHFLLHLPWKINLLLTWKCDSNIFSLISLVKNWLKINFSYQNFTVEKNYFKRRLFFINTKNRIGQQNKTLVNGILGELQNNVFNNNNNRCYYGCLISQVFFLLCLQRYSCWCCVLRRRLQPRSRPRLLLLMASTKFGVAFQTSSFLKGFLATSLCSLLDFGLVLYLGMYM